MERKLFAAAVICAALMVGCEKPQPEEPDKKPDKPLEPEKPDKPDQPEKPDEPTWQMTDVELTGEIEAIGTKTSFTDGKVAWKAGDKISVFYTAEGKSETAEFASAAEGTSAKFTGKLNLLIDPKKPTEIPVAKNGRSILQQLQQHSTALHSQSPFRQPRRHRKARSQLKVAGLSLLSPATTNSVSQQFAAVLASLSRG